MPILLVVMMPYVWMSVMMTIPFVGIELVQKRS